MGNSIPIEMAIARIIELYNEAKKEGKEYPTEWAIRKTNEWLHRKELELIKRQAATWKNPFRQY